MKRGTIRVVVADDHPAIRAGLQGELDKAEDVEVVGEASSGEEALRMVEALAADLLLLDMALPGQDGVEVARRLRETHPEVRVLVYSGYTDDAFVFGVLEAGAMGYLLKDEEIACVVEAVRATMRGEVVLSGRVAQKLARRTMRRERLTGREEEVLMELVGGKSTEEIAEALGITAKTVSNHVSNMLSKFGLTSRAELVAYAMREGTVQLRGGKS